MTYSRFLITLSAWVIAGNCLGYTLDNTVIGNALGYPHTQLVVTDVTEAERKLYTTTVEGEGDGLRAHIEPDRILQSVRITSRIRQTFYPILVTVAKKGTFLSPQFRNLVEMLNAIPADERKKQGMKHLGRFSIENVGAGGCVIASIRIPSSVKEMTEPFFGMSVVTELRLENESADIRVAMFLTLDEGGRVPLLKVDGGETYYATFNSTSGFEDSDPASGTKTFDWNRGLTVLNLEAQRAFKVASVVPQASSDKAPRISNSRNVPERDSIPWAIVLVMVFVAISLLWLVLKRRAK